MKIWLDDARVDLAPTALIAQGGEAEIYELGSDRVVKLFKTARHADVAGIPALEAAATARLVEHQAKLPAFPRGLPARVVAPTSLATLTRRGELVGYAMPRVPGAALYHVGDPRWRRDHGASLAAAVAALCDLGATVAALHAADVVIGDFNDLNVLVEDTRAWIIDTDSFQYGAWRCAMFTERTVDPRLCAPAPAEAVLIAPHDRASDWFAFAVMAFRTLFGVGPYGGVHAPVEPARRIAPGQRARHGISLYDREVRAPRASAPLAIVPDELHAIFEPIFARRVRLPFPVEQLARLRVLRCATCGVEHARRACPSCATAVAVPAAIVRDGVRALPLAAHEFAPRSWAVGRAPIPGAPAVWLDGGMLWRQTALGPELIGQVLAGQTRAWTSALLGFGFYRAGAWTVGFVFRPDRRGLDDRVALPRIRGLLVDAHAAVGDDRAWLFLREALAGVDHVHCVVIGATGAVLATHSAPADAAPWPDLARGAVATGAHLFVPTDAGVIRLDASAGLVSVSRTFSSTAEFVAAGDELALGPRGLDVRRAARALRLEL